MTRRRRGRVPGRGRLIDRLWIPGREGLKQFVGAANGAYDVKFVRGDLFNGKYIWRVPVTVPVYDTEITLRIELERFGVEVLAEDWAGPMKHTFGSQRLCMWYPHDPDDRKWRIEDGLLKLLDTAVMHLFMELYFRETGDWPGKEAPHEVPKVDGRASAGRAA